MIKQIKQKQKVTEKIESIYESMHILQNGKYDDQS